MRMVDGGFAEDAGGTRSNRLVDEFVPVGRLTLHRDEEVALSHLARIEGDALHREVGAGGATGCRRERARGPPRAHAATRSEERRVGKECGSTCRSRRSPYN